MREKLRGIIITGFMGTGKTAVGKSLSRRLGMEFVDLDDEIEVEAGMGITEIFSQVGESGFRDVEKRTLRKVLKIPGRVVSTGGGTVLAPENLSLMKTYGMVICLWAKPEVVLKRLERNEDRPLLKEEDRLTIITKLMDERRSQYRFAGRAIITDDRSVEDISTEIASIWRESIDG